MLASRIAPTTRCRGGLFAVDGMHSMAAPGVPAGMAALVPVGIRVPRNNGRRHQP